MAAVMWVFFAVTVKQNLDFWDIFMKPYNYLKLCLTLKKKSKQNLRLFHDFDQLTQLGANFIRGDLFLFIELLVIIDPNQTRLIPGSIFRGTNNGITTLMSAVQSPATRCCVRPRACRCESVGSIRRQKRRIAVLQEGRPRRRVSTWRRYNNDSSANCADTSSHAELHLITRPIFTALLLLLRDAPSSLSNTSV